MESYSPTKEEFSIWEGGVSLRKYTPPMLGRKLFWGNTLKRWHNFCYFRRHRSHCPVDTWKTTGAGFCSLFELYMRSGDVASFCHQFQATKRVYFYRRCLAAWGAGIHLNTNKRLNFQETNIIVLTYKRATRSSFSTCCIHPCGRSSTFATNTELYIVLRKSSWGFVVLSHPNILRARNIHDFWPLYAIFGGAL